MLGSEFRRFRVARVSHVMRGLLGEPEARITVLREFGILAGAVEGHIFLAVATEPLLKEGPGIARAGASAKKNLTASRSNLGLSDLAWFDPPVTNSADSFCPSSSPLMAAKNSVLKRHPKYQRFRTGALSQT